MSSQTSHPSEAQAPAVSGVGKINRRLAIQDFMAP